MTSRSRGPRCFRRSWSPSPTVFLYMTTSAFVAYASRGDTPPPAARRPDKFYMYDFIKQSLCTFYFPHLRNTVVLDSKAGWLLARRRDGDDHDDDQVFFLYSLFTLEKMDLPKHKIYSEQVGSFVVPSTTATPPRDFLAFIVSRPRESSLEISLCREAAGNDLRWEVQRIRLGDNDRFGTTRAVDCSDCNCVGRCNGAMMQKKESIYINGSKDGLCYDFVNKKVVRWVRYVLADCDRMNRVTKDWHRHRQIWQKGFGAEDISISVGAGSLSLDCPYWGRVLPYWRRVLANTTTAIEEEEEEEEEVKMIKAAWVQPMFPKFCKKKLKLIKSLSSIFH